MRERSASLTREFGVYLTREAVLAKIGRLGLSGWGGNVYIKRAASRWDAPPSVTLPSVGGAYAYVRGRLLRDGVAVAMGRA